MRLSKRLAIATTLAAVTVAIHAFPDRPITVVVPYAAGGSTDVLARILVDAMGKDLGQAVVVENIGGAGGTLGTAKVTRAPKDGYTVLLHNMAIATAPALYAKLSYDVQKDLDAVSLLGDVPMILVRSKRFAPASIAQLVSAMKDKPGSVNFAHAGTGATSHLCALLFSQATGTTSTLVPYRGTGPALTDLVAGNVDIICDQPVATGPHIQSGALVPYAVSGVERLASMPTVATFAQAGVNNFNPVVWHGMYVPKGTPAAVVARLNKAVQSALGRSELAQRFQDMGVVIPAKDRQSAQAAQALTNAELERWVPIINAVGIKVD